jgi:hypothetical protein
MREFVGEISQETSLGRPNIRWKITLRPVVLGSGCR